MRTKTMLLSTLLGALGSVSVHAQNVYSLNAVGYINITIYPGFNIISCPLIASPNNTVGSLLNNGDGHLTGTTLDFFSPITGPTFDSAENQSGKPSTSNTNGWVNNGTNVLAPGVACWFQSPFSSNITVTFVGTVPSGPITNSLFSGYNLVSSVVPASGDIITNSLMGLTNYNLFDTVFTFNPAGNPVNETYQSGSGKGYGGFGYSKSGGAGDWNANGDPILPTVGGGFFYENNTASTTVQWVENYSVAQ
jgi:hypothetical protein